MQEGRELKARDERLVEQPAEVLAVIVGKRGGEPLDFRGRDEAHPVGDLLDAGDLQALPLLDRLHEIRGLEQRLVRARVEPGEAAAEDLDRELAALACRRG